MSENGKPLNVNIRGFSEKEKAYQALLERHRDAMLRSIESLDWGDQLVALRITFTAVLRRWVSRVDQPRAVSIFFKQVEKAMGTGRDW